MATTTTTTEKPEEIEVTPKATIKRKYRKVSIATTETRFEVETTPKTFVEKKFRKSLSTTEKFFAAEKPEQPKNFKDSPRQLVKFEPEDAKFNAEYEKLKQSRKLKHRVKRSSEDEKKSNTTRKAEKFVTRDTFVQPRELFKFSYLDAATKAPQTNETNESEKKTKREITDSTAVESKNVVQMSNPMRNQRSTKHVSYHDISQTLQKMIDAALKDAVSKGKASEGDYLKFFYGDTIIKVPVSMSKYVLHKTKENQTSYPHSKKVATYPSNIGEEETKTESPKLLATKNSYHQYLLKNSKIKFDVTLPHFLPTPQTQTEKSESFENFETPIVVQSGGQENNFSLGQKSGYQYSNDDVYYGRNPGNSVSSPGPVLFHQATTPSTVENSHQYKNFIYHPPTKLSIVKEEIPIVEHIDEDFSYIPLIPQNTHMKIPVPTSYVEYTGDRADTHEEKKNYEFGYVSVTLLKGNVLTHLSQFQISHF